MPTIWFDTRIARNGKSFWSVNSGGCANAHSGFAKDYLAAAPAPASTATSRKPRFRGVVWRCLPCDELGEIYDDQMFTSATRRRSVGAPVGRLALLTLVCLIDYKGQKRFAISPSLELTPQERHLDSLCVFRLSRTGDSNLDAAITHSNARFDLATSARTTALSPLDRMDASTASIRKSCTRMPSSQAPLFNLLVGCWVDV